MKISHMLRGQKIIKKIGDFRSVNIQNLACDTKNVRDKCLFFCFKGSVTDGHSFAQSAVDRGAVALVVERPLDMDVPQIVVENARSAMAVLAGNFYGNPRDKIKLIGIAGTNGKTTTTYMLQSILKSAGYKVGVIGTIGIVIDDLTLPTQLTTPDPIELHSLFAQMVNKQVDFVVMEVSAHAIALDKMAGVVCDVGILTNITQDHIDFFHSFEKYKDTKLSFLNPQYCKQGVVNVDDCMGRKFYLRNLAYKTGYKIHSFGLNNPSDVFAVDYKFGLDGTHYFINLFDEVKEVKTGLIGQFNLYNALGSSTACHLLGIQSKHIVQGLGDMQSVPGRFNVVDLGDGRKAVLDYAHTPDGLTNILTSVRQITNGKVISVFGCGGNRDAVKRPIMGKISASLADFSILTSDNPRLEEPLKIINEIENGAKEVNNKYLCIENRKDAIRYALSMLESGDVAVVSGKGAENYLDMGGVKYPYSDLETIKRENDRIRKETQLIK